MISEVKVPQGRQVLAYAYKKSPKGDNRKTNQQEKLRLKLHQAPVTNY